MKGFKSTGRGPRYGNFSFPDKAGFGPSSGKVKQIGGYTRRAPMRKAVGGLVEGGPFQAGWNDFKRGGKVKSSKTGKLKTPRTPSPAHKSEGAMALSAKMAARNLKATRSKKPGLFED